MLDSTLTSNGKFNNFWIFRSFMIMNFEKKYFKNKFMINLMQSFEIQFSIYEKWKTWKNCIKNSIREKNWDKFLISILNI
jgi:hypothetical protein